MFDVEDLAFWVMGWNLYMTVRDFYTTTGSFYMNFSSLYTATRTLDATFHLSSQETAKESSSPLRTEFRYLTLLISLSRLV
ncbi:hypothetical protein A1A1_02942 [Planococcus antarcticus DSM 14505]|uniref:Uncharacterized protein n=1 Tax=Planococcus antarcticus DSM 14505 TaxID=1185653 RepID=A0A1C7DL78_9BACL|nr:hypothetical protein [Planococcus antarcticus]ANU12031.1 hypothetical protein BBH88_18100 [Planococcus antarcticus DSM 14505]EIM08014.1 hypothetical protein A1A1_02942 [Planococcus antarcticus DSM 14505]